MSHPKVLVTGATGFLGQHLLERLFKNDYQVSILARSDQGLDHLKKRGVRIYRGDITERLALLEATQNQDIVFHLAGLIAYKKTERALMEKVNVLGTGNVIDACVTNQVGQLLHLSSVVTIGASFKPQAINEEFNYNLGPYNLGYFETKRKAEQLIQQAVEHNKLNALMINPSTIYGAGDALKGSRKTQVKVAKGKFLFYPPGGVNVVSVHDVIDGIFLALKKGVPGRRYIISGDNLTIHDLFKIIAETAGKKTPPFYLPQSVLKIMGFLGDQLKPLGLETSLSSETAVTSTLYHWFSSERAQKELGFKPSSSKEAIRESVQWMIANKLLD